MGDFLSIDNVSNSNNHIGIVGGKDAEIDETRIDDTIYGSGDTLAKMGSSIPTIVARMYFFATAFDQINTEEVLHASTGHRGKINSSDLLVPTSYHFLASECLDLLEFLFIYGDDKDHENFEAVPWLIDAETNQLMSEDFKHKKLGKAIRSAMGKPIEGGDPGHETNPLYSTQRIYLFYWKENGKRVLLGGTSPISLVFTSPNLIRDLRDAGLRGKFKGLAGNVLFDDSNATPLIDRSEGFRKYLYSLQMLTLKADTGFDPNKTTSFPFEPLRKYIEVCRDVYEEATIRGSVSKDPAQTLQTVSKNRTLKDAKNAEVLICSGMLYTAGAGGARVGREYNVSLYCSPNTLSLSDYRIVPTTDIFGKVVVDGAVQEVDTPLVLCNEGVPGALYVSGRTWQQGIDTVPQQRPYNLNDRSLPGTHIKHPYLDINDFLEEKIIEVSYKLNKDNFYTGTPKDSTFLLPLKKNFFLYFTMDDLMPTDDQKRFGKKSLLKMDYKDDSASGKNIVEVELTIPIAFGRPVVFRRVYDAAHQVDCYDTNNSFDLAVFPFYKREVKDNVDPNRYAVMLGYTADTNLRFYRIEDLTNQVGGDVDKRRLPVEPVQRSDKSNNSISTRHYAVPSEFDLIEVDVKQGGVVASGLVVPLFKGLPAASKEFIFGVDFGTTNTYLSYAEIKGEGINRTLVGTLQGFDIKPDEDQVVTLNEEDDFGTMSVFSTSLNREFVPDIIDNSPTGKKYRFPIRTSTCEVAINDIPKLELFSSCNIGFNHNNELITSGLACRYRTNLKWDRSGGIHSTERLEVYFTELLWMMRNKSWLNGGNDKFDVIITYPLSMGDMELSDFKKAWEKACTSLGMPENFFKDRLKFETESITPYYAFLKGLKFNEPYMNIDIGGGTSDILYVNPKTEDYATFSAFFAANDIWGDGCNLAATKCENGFIDYYRRSIYCQQNPNFDENILKVCVENTLGNNGTSADVISYLFSHGESKFADSIRQSPEMRQIPLVHFAALIFYVANILDTTDYDAPTSISFTGMGSKYLDLISENRDSLGRLITDIFNYYATVMGNPRLKDIAVKVSFPDAPKEVTANGAVIMNTNVKSVTEAPATVIYGFEEEEFGSSVKYGGIEAKQPKVIALYEVFTKLFADDAFVSDVANLNIGIEEGLGASLRGIAEQSYALIVKRTQMEKRNSNLRVKEPLFFWPIKDALYQLTNVYNK